jgi:hypothetical protein
VGLGKSRKRDQQVNAFRTLWEANEQMATGSAYRMGDQGMGDCGERTRVLRQKGNY